MSANALLLKRFDELVEDSKKIGQTARTEAGVYGGSSRFVDADLFLKWRVKVKDLVLRLCGGDSVHYQQLLDAEKPQIMDSSHNIFARMNAVFEAAMEDFKSGYLMSIRSLIQAELFDSELEQATELLRAGYKVPGAVIAGTVLEASLREHCTKRNIPQGNADRMNDDLTKDGLYNSLVAKRIRALLGIRNSAAHGKKDDFTDADVKSMIEEIGRFLVQVTQ